MVVASMRLNAQHLPLAPLCQRARRLGAASFTLLLALFLVLVAPQVAHAASVDISLSEADSSAHVNTPFKVESMLPGDSESLEARVRVEHKEPSAVYLQVADLQETKHLSGTLEVSVTDRETGRLVSRATLGDLAKGFKVAELPASSTGVSSLAWNVAVSLPTSAGNEYANARASFKLVWSVAAPGQPGAEVPGNPSTPGETAAPGGTGILPGILGKLPQTGDIPWYLACLALLAAGVICLERANRACGEMARGGGTLSGGVAADVASAPLVVNEVVAAALPESRRRTSRLRIADRKKKSISLLMLGIICLVGTAALAWALFWAHAELPGNSFQTGEVKIDLNGGKPVFANDIDFEPGRSLTKDFTITNTGTADCYWRLHAAGIAGDLDDSLMVDILDKSTGATLYSGSLAGFRDPQACQGADVLPAGQSVALTAVVRMADHAGNDYQGSSVSFDLVADATQTRNNAGREF